MLDIHLAQDKHEQFRFRQLYFRPFWDVIFTSIISRFWKVIYLLQIEMRDTKYRWSYVHKQQSINWHVDFAMTKKARWVNMQNRQKKIAKICVLCQMSSENCFFGVWQFNSLNDMWWQCAVIQSIKICYNTTIVVYVSCTLNVMPIPSAIANTTHLDVTHCTQVLFTF